MFRNISNQIFIISGIHEPKLREKTRTDILSLKFLDTAIEYRDTDTALYSDTDDYYHVLLGAVVTALVMGSIMLAVLVFTRYIGFGNIVFR